MKLTMLVTILWLLIFDRRRKRGATKSDGGKKQ